MDLTSPIPIIMCYMNGARLTTHSEDTLARIRSASIESLESDQELAILSDYILSIVPPRDALDTADRIATACKLPGTMERRKTLEDTDGLPTRRKLYFIDLNAISSRQSAEVGSLFVGTPTTSSGGPSVSCHYLDGGIIGPPPSNNSNSPDRTWKKPSLIVSGDVELPATFPGLSEILNIKMVSPKIGAASTLKLSFAALTKGLTALSILSFSTAQQESLLPDLFQHLDEYAPAVASTTKKLVTGMAPKAYRWTDEMRAIGEAFDTDGHWNGIGGAVFDSFAEVYRTIAEDTVLGEEKVGRRTRGTTAEDAAEIIASSRGQTRTT